MTVLLQISDPHFGTERIPVAQALADLTRQQRPDVLILSGDITQRATTVQVATTRRLVDRLAVPRRLAIPGNHDISLFNPAARLLWPYANYRHHFGADLEPELVQAGTAVSGRTRHQAENSVNLIRIGSTVLPASMPAFAAPRQAMLERWDFGAVSRRFVAAEPRKLQCGEVELEAMACAGSVLPGSPTAARGCSTVIDVPAAKSRCRSGLAGRTHSGDNSASMIFATFIQ